MLIIYAKSINLLFSGIEYFRVAKFVFSPMEFFVESVFRLLQHEITRSNFISFSPLLFLIIFTSTFYSYVT